MAINLEFNPKMEEIKVFYPKTQQIIKRKAHRAMFKTFHRILLCLHLTGPYPNGTKSRFKKVLHSFPKYLYGLLSITSLVLFFYSLVQEFGKSKILSFMELLMRALVWCTILRNRGAFHSLLDTLYSASEGLPRVFLLEQIKLKVSLSIFVMFLLMVPSSVLHYIATIQNSDYKHRYNDGVESLLHFEIVASDLQIGFFCLYYSTVCDYIQRCCQCIELMFISGSEVSYKRIIGLYHNISDAIHEVDSRLSFTLFLCVLNIMACLFWMGYHFSFSMLSSLRIASTLLYVTIYSTTILRVLWAGSTATEAADEVLGKVMTLPGILPSKYQEIKVMLCRKNRDRNRLTLWKMFVVRRSLIVSIFGGLLTYGIMIGALGSIQD